MRWTPKETVRHVENWSLFRALEAPVADDEPLCRLLWSSFKTRLMTLPIRSGRKTDLGTYRPKRKG